MRLHANISYCSMSVRQFFFEEYQELIEQPIPDYSQWSAVISARTAILRVQAVTGQGAHCLGHGNLLQSEDHLYHCPGVLMTMLSDQRCACIC